MKQTSVTGKVLLPFFSTTISMAHTCDDEIRFSLGPDQLSLPEKCKAPVIPKNFPKAIISINTIPPDNSGGDTFYAKQKNNRNIDCTITPTGKLKKNGFQDNEPGMGALGAATARPGFPVNDIFASANRWKRMVTGALKQP